MSTENENVLLFLRKNHRAIVLLTTLLSPIIDFVILVGEGIVMWSLLGSCALKTSGARDWLPLDALHTIQYRTLQSAGSSRMMQN